MVLAGNGTLHPAQDDAAIAHARPRTVLLNARLCALARHADDVTCLASPVTGGAVQVARIDQLFLLARSLGHEGRCGHGGLCRPGAGAQGQRIVQDGKALADAEQAQALGREAQVFDAERLPLLRAFGLA
ncbi:hypothetical protein [Massilia timonae]|uniref:Methyltransferase regulatory, predicted domain protein n=1 Tax=Massilia timonae TaxID=47229 RepID=A0A1S2N6E3_9BURK|nr:hypothetical protein [Massilia timonae]OIJ40184.1 methyltransferase regulatory, predicted domain protein [Massilia timonae]